MHLARGSIVAATSVLTRPRKQSRDATLQKADTLLAAAAALIAEKGFEATAIRDVGRRLEVSLGGMYYYFASKDDLLFQIQHRTFTALLAEQERVAEQPGSAEDRLHRLLVGHLAFFARHPNEMKICTFELESLKGDFYDRVLVVRRRYFRLVADVIADLTGRRERKPRGHDRHVTLFVFGMLNWAFMWYQTSKDGPVEAVAAEMLELIVNGAAPRKRR
ncbi:MAG: TetR family transcriptional regulator [Gemmatimonadetes bacterium]|nr:TetR family transcriptional regulator [Gemmatimonadota bacterium]MCC7134324.1 TetR family transcriptional regulator [Gemmatimonadales bacterium]